MNMSSQQNRDQEFEDRIAILERKIWQIEAYLSDQEEDVDE